MMMMLDFIFKYTWLAMLVIGYGIWTFASIKQITDDSETISPSAESWIVVTLSLIVLIIGTLFVTSFTYWLNHCIG